MNNHFNLKEYIHIDHIESQLLLTTNQPGDWEGLGNRPYTSVHNWQYNEGFNYIQMIIPFYKVLRSPFGSSESTAFRSLEREKKKEKDIIVHPRNKRVDYTACWYANTES